MIGRLPWLLDVAALVLGWTGGSMIYNDHIVGPYLSGVPYANVVIPVIGVLLVLTVDIVLRWRAARKRQPTTAVDSTPSEPSNETTGVK